MTLGNLIHCLPHPLCKVVYTDKKSKMPELALTNHMAVNFGKREGRDKLSRKIGFVEDFSL